MWNTFMKILFTLLNFANLAWFTHLLLELVLSWVSIIKFILFLFFCMTFCLGLTLKTK